MTKDKTYGYMYRKDGPWPDSYLREIRKFPRMTVQEEREIGLRVKNGDRDARDEMIVRNFRMVISISRKYIGYGIPIEDIISWGTIGLIRAVDKNEPKFGYRFATYAYKCIRSEIIESLRSNNNDIIRLPKNISEFESCIRRGIPVRDWKRHLVEHSRSIRKMRRWDAYLCDSGDTEGIPVLPTPADDRDGFQERELNIDLLRKCLLKLSAAERRIVMAEFNIRGRIPGTVRFHGSLYGLDDDGIVATRDRAIAKLKSMMESEGFSMSKAEDGYPVPLYRKDDVVTSLDRPDQRGIVLGIAEEPMKVNPGYMGEHWNLPTYWVEFGNQRFRYSQEFLRFWIPPAPQLSVPVPEPPCPVGLRVVTSRGPGTVMRSLGRSTGWPPGSVEVQVDPNVVRFKGELIERGGPMYCMPDEIAVLDK